MNTEAGLQALRLFLYTIEDAARFHQNVGAFLVGIALAEKLLKHGAGVAFLRQRLFWCAPCDASAALCRGEFKRRQACVLTDVAYGDLIGADARVGTGLAEVPGLYAGQPALLDVAVRLVCFRGLVAQAGDDGQVAAERLERIQGSATW